MACWSWWVGLQEEAALVQGQEEAGVPVSPKGHNLCKMVAVKLWPAHLSQQLPQKAAWLPCLRRVGGKEAVTWEAGGLNLPI